jgi:hypothetical protein
MNTNKLAVSVLLTANGLDAGLTLATVRLGYATELNPIMGCLLNISPFAFLSVKVLMVLVGASILMKYQSSLMARIALHGLADIYVALFLWSIWNLP